MSTTVPREVSACLALPADLVYQDEELTVSTTADQVATVDLAIPEDAVVTGSGVVVTEANPGGGFTAWDSLSDGQKLSASQNLSWSSGPHPSDDTLWRFQMTTNGAIVRVRMWMAILSPSGA